MQAIEITRIQQWNRALWSQQNNLEKQFSFNDYILWFPKGNKSHLGNFTKKWFGPYRVQYVLPHNTMLLVTIEKFETNPMLVNMNKLKPYKYMEYEVQKNEQQMPIYWEKSVGGVKQVNSHIEEDNEGCQIWKPQMKNDENKEQITNPIVNTVFSFSLQMHNKCNSGRFGMQKSTNDMSSVLVELAVIFIWSL